MICEYELTGVQIDPSLSDDDLRGDGNVRVTFVQHLSNLQQDMRAVHPIQKPVKQEDGSDGPLRLICGDAVSEKHLESQQDQISDSELFTVSDGPIVTSNCGRCFLTRSDEFVLSSDFTDCLYCHFSSTNGHFLSAASCRSMFSSSGNDPEGERSEVKPCLMSFLDQCFVFVHTMKVKRV